jgi:hypothetical protein
MSVGLNGVSELKYYSITPVEWSFNAGTGWFTLNIAAAVPPNALIAEIFTQSDTVRGALGGCRKTGTAIIRPLGNLEAGGDWMPQFVEVVNQQVDLLDGAGGAGQRIYYSVHGYFAVGG